MATLTQIDANRANAQHSTGPRTLEGKARSARNNLRHGFRSQTVILPGEDPAEYSAMLAELTAHLHPASLTETRLVREMADAEWRLRRARVCQEEMLSVRVEDLSALHPDLTIEHIHAAAFNSLFKETGFINFLRYEARFERQYNGSYKTLLAARKAAAPPQRTTARTAPRRPSSVRRLVTNEANSTSRNAPCPCGSGLKFKRCCGKSAPPALKTTPKTVQN
jgi:hypothetical protein